MVEIFTPTIPSFAIAITAYIYVAVGVALAFFGRAIWGRFMTLLGIVLGAAVGYNLGSLLLPGLVSLALAVVGAAIGGMIFTWLVEVSLAAMAGALGLYVTYRSLLEYMVPGDALVAGILVMLVIFSLTFYYMEGLMSYVTALLGGVLGGIGLFLLTADLPLSFGAAVATIVLGVVVQELVVKRYEERFKKALKRPVRFKS